MIIKEAGGKEKFKIFLLGRFKCDIFSPRNVKSKFKETGDAGPCLPAAVKT